MQVIQLSTDVEPELSAHHTELMPAAAAELAALARVVARRQMAADAMVVEQEAKE